MPQRKEAFLLGGAKFALEGKGSVPPVYDFLENRGITAGIVKMADIKTNGHTVLTAWTGTEIDTGELSKKSIARAGGTGCLEIVNGSGEIKTEIFFKEGQVIKTIREPKGINPRQRRMKI